MRELPQMTHVSNAMQENLVLNLAQKGRWTVSLVHRGHLLQHQGNPAVRNAQTIHIILIRVLQNAYVAHHVPKVRTGLWNHAHPTRTQSVLSAQTRNVWRASSAWAGVRGRIMASLARIARKVAIAQATS